MSCNCDSGPCQDVPKENEVIESVILVDRLTQTPMELMETFFIRLCATYCRLSCKEKCI